MFEEMIGSMLIAFNCKLGTTVKIKTKFGKPFMQVIQGIETLDTLELIKILYCGVDKEVISYNDFETLVLEEIGLMDLYELVQKFVKKIQYPGLSFEEIDEKMNEGKKEVPTED